MKIRLGLLRRMIREAYGTMATPSLSVGLTTPSGAVDPTQHDEQPSLDLDDAAQKLQVGFYPYEIERGVPAPPPPPPIIKSTKLGP